MKDQKLVAATPAAGKKQEKAGPALKVAVTCVERKAKEELARSIEALGFSLVEDVRQADVVVAGDHSAGMAAGNTFKVMSAISKGLPLVDASWLQFSAKEGAAQDHKQFLVASVVEARGKELPVPKLGEYQPRFLDGWTVHTAFKKYGENGVPTKKDLQMIVEAAGGELELVEAADDLGGGKAKGPGAKFLILTDADSLASKTLGAQIKQLAEETEPAGGGVQSLEALYSGAMAQRLDRKAHLLWKVAIECKDGRMMKIKDVVDFFDGL